MAFSPKRLDCIRQTSFGLDARSTVYLILPSNTCHWGGANHSKNETFVGGLILHRTYQWHNSYTVSYLHKENQGAFYRLDQGRADPSTLCNDALNMGAITQVTNTSNPRSNIHLEDLKLKDGWLESRQKADTSNFGTQDIQPQGAYQIQV